jgi:hypothetical protein
VAKGAQGYIKQARTSRGAQVYSSMHKEYKGHILQGGHHGQRTLLFSLRVANTLYQVPLFHSFFVAFALRSP